MRGGISSSAAAAALSFTRGCEAPPSFWGGGAIPLVKKDGGTVKTYEHPTEIRSTPHRELTLRDVNSMYCISNEDLVRYFPEGIGGKVAQLFVPGHPRGFLYRQHSHLLNQLIGKAPFMTKKIDAIRALCDGRPGVIFDGETGVGKSALMCQAVHYARSLGVLTMYVPNCKDWTHGEWAWPSLLLPGFWDAPDAGRQLLLYFARAHRDILADMPLKVTPKEKLPVQRDENAPQNLHELCQWGVRGGSPSNLDRQSAALKFLMDELMAEKNRPIVFVLDGANLLAGNTHFRFPHPDFYRTLTSWSDTDVDLFPQELPRIPAARFSFVRALNKMMLDADKNKLFVTATTRNFTPFDGGVAGFEDPIRDRNKHDALDEYNQDENFDPVRDTVLHPLQVGNLNEYEYRSFVRFLVNSGELAGLGWGPMWHYSPPFERKLYKIDFLSGRNPQRVIDNYHGEIVWVREYGRIRQKQHMLASAAADRRAREGEALANGGAGRRQQTRAGGPYQRNPRKPSDFANEKQSS